MKDTTLSTIQAVRYFSDRGGERTLQRLTREGFLHDLSHNRNHRYGRKEIAPTAKLYDRWGKKALTHYLMFLGILYIKVIPNGQV